MATVWAEPFDYETAAQLDRSYSSVSAGITLGAFGPNGESAVKLAGDRRYEIWRSGMTWIAGSVAIFEIDFRITAYPGINNRIYSILDGLGSSDAAVQTEFRLLTDGTIEVQRGHESTRVSLGVSTYVVPLNTDIHLSGKVVIHPSAGTITVDVYESQSTTPQVLFALTGKNTRLTGTAQWNGFVLGCGADAGYTVFANVVLNDGSGSVNNDRFGQAAGRIRVISKRAMADGAHTSSTPSTGSSRAAMVDDATPDDDTTYTAASSAGDADSFDLADVAETDDVLAVSLLWIAKKSSGTPGLQALAREAGIDTLGTAIPLTTAYTDIITPTLYQTTPAGSTLSAILVNAMEWGYQLSAAGDVRVTQLVLIAVVRARADAVVEVLMSNDPEVGVIWVKIYDQVGNLIRVESDVDLPDRAVYHGGFKYGHLTDVGEVDRSTSNRFDGLEVPSFSFKLFDADGFWRARAAVDATRDFTGLGIVYHTIPDAGRRAEETPRTLFRGKTRTHKWADLTLAFECEDYLSAELAVNNDKQQIPKRSYPKADFDGCDATKASSSAGSTYVANGAASIGATELAVKNGVGQFAAGDKITLVGHADPYTISRSSNTGLTWQELTAATELTETRIYLDSALTAGVADNATITQVPNHDVPAAVGTSVPFGYNLISDYKIVDGEDVGDGQTPARFLGDEVWADGKSYGVMGIYGHSCYSPSAKPIQGIYLWNNPMDLATLAATGKRIACPGYSNWATVGFANSFDTRNGNDYTFFGLRGVFRDWALGITPPPPNLGGVPLAVNVYGHDTNNDSTGTLITSGPQIYKHLWKNYLKGDYRSGAPLLAPAFADDPTLSMLDEASFDRVETLQGLRIPGGYELAFGFGFNGERISYDETIVRLNKSNGCRSMFNGKVQFAITMADDNPATALANAETLDDVNDILDESSNRFEIDDQDLNLANIYRYVHTPDYLGRSDPRNLVSLGGWRSAITTIGFNEAQYSASVAVHGKVYGQRIELFCIRAKNVASDPDWMQQGKDTAEDIIKHLLRETSEAPRAYTIPTSMRGANITFELGQTMYIEDFKNIGGRTARPVLIRRSKVRAGSDSQGKVVTFIADDLGRVLYQALAVEYVVGAADASGNSAMPSSSGGGGGLNVPITQTVTPTALGLHAPTHAAGGTDPVTLTEAQITGLVSDLALKAPIASPTFTGTVTLAADPASALQAATKQYVDGIAANLGKRARVRAATTATITISTGLNNGDALDGVTLVTGDLVLVKNQAAPEANGVYVVGVTPARFAEFDTYDEHPGSLIAVEEGTAGADTLWLCTSNVGGTLETTALAFSQLVITAGAGAVAMLGITIDGGTGVLTTGVKGFLRVPFACTINSVTLLSTDAAVTSGSIVIDIWKDVYANYPPTVADTITASAKPTLSSAVKSEDTTLTGWVTSIVAGDVLGFNVDSVTSLKRVTLVLKVTKT